MLGSKVVEDRVAMRPGRAKPLRSRALCDRRSVAPAARRAVATARTALTVAATCSVRTGLVTSLAAVVSAPPTGSSFTPSFTLPFTVTPGTLAARPIPPRALRAPPACTVTTSALREGLGDEGFVTAGTSNLD
ncbi:MAG: hypothetical protein R2698_11440 [Microthrixaceae bacterium]